MLNGKPMTAANIAGQIGLTPSQVTKLLGELLDNGVARKAADGAVFSKRMVSDEAVRNARAAGGQAGAEHGGQGAQYGALGGRPTKQQRGEEKPPLITPLKRPPSSSSSKEEKTGAASQGTHSPTLPSKTGKSRTEKAPETTLAEWLDGETAAGRKAVPGDDTIFGWAEKIALPREFLQLAWFEFKARYTAAPTKGDRPKTYTDWRAVFRKAVRENWLKLWYIDGEQYLLTSTGLQAKREHQPGAHGGRDER